MFSLLAASAHSSFPSFGTIGVWAALVAVGLAAAAAIGAAFRNGRTTQAISNWRNLAESYQATAKAQEQEIAELKTAAAHETSVREAEMRKKDLQIHALTERVATLQDLVTGRAAFEELSVSIAGLISQMETRTSESLAQVGAIRTDLRDLAGKVQEIHGELTPGEHHDRAGP